MTIDEKRALATLIRLALRAVPEYDGPPAPTGDDLEHLDDMLYALDLETA